MGIKVIGEVGFHCESPGEIGFDVISPGDVGFHWDDASVSVTAPTQHVSLLGRDEPDQHPIPAITGLQSELDTRPSEIIPISYIDSLR